MEILEISTSAYAEILPQPFQIYSSAPFNNLKNQICNTLVYLLFKDSKYRLVLIAGIRNKELYSPCSAPFGGFSFLSPDIRLQVIDEAIALLKTWANEKNIESINITLPPTLYNESFIAKQSNCLYRAGYYISKIDLNYYFNLSDFDNNYVHHIWYNAVKNLKISQRVGLTFKKCEVDADKKLAYEIIRKNRDAKGYPLRMTWQQVYETIRIVPADFFIVNNDYQLPIASAIIFHVNEIIVQVIYWGDLPYYAKLKPMNFLSFKVFEYYKSSGKKAVDIGPSTENSIPNYGLCEFKESIGCNISQKLTFSKIL